jgi:hypothetical protein
MYAAFADDGVEPQIPGIARHPRYLLKLVPESDHPTRPLGAGKGAVEVTGAAPDSPAAGIPGQQRDGRNNVPQARHRYQRTAGLRDPEGSRS